MGLINLKNVWNEINNWFTNTSSNLKAGRGDPCAGQVSDIDVIAFLTNVRDLDSNENLGFVPPTGSTIQYHILKLGMSTI